MTMAVANATRAKTEDVFLKNMAMAGIRTEVIRSTKLPRHTGNSSRERPFMNGEADQASHVSQYHDIRPTLEEGSVHTHDRSGAFDVNDHGST